MRSGFRIRGSGQGEDGHCKDGRDEAMPTHALMLERRSATLRRTPRRDGGRSIKIRARVGARPPRNVRS